jgi:hypothetical protein
MATATKRVIVRKRGRAWAARAMATATKREMMTYDRRAQLYHGDENFRKVTRLGKRKKKGTILEGGKGWSKFGKLQNCKDFESPFAFASLWPVRIPRST